MRICSTCFEQREESEFYKVKQNKNGMSGQCVKCKKEYNKNRYASCRSSRQEIQRRYYRKNIESEKLRSIKKYSTPSTRMNQILSRVYRKALHEERKFDLTKEFLIELLELQDSKCALTGIPFDFSPPQNGNKRNPFGPSIDRKDNSLDYTKDNVQFLCWIVNAAKNEYDTSIFDTICKARVRKLNGS